MSNQDVVDFVIGRVALGMELDKICEAMTDNCLASNSMNGVGCDNMTVVIVGFYTQETKADWIKKITLLAGQKMELSAVTSEGSYMDIK
jgi:serine/threonine protein phosphatase PrpC